MSAAPEVAYGASPAEKRQAADRILRALPAWFGIDSAREADTARCVDLPVLLTRRDGKVVGFLALQETSPAACEVYAIGAPTGRFFPRKIARGIEAVYPLRPQKNARRKSISASKNRSRIPRPRFCISRKTQSSCSAA